QRISATGGSQPDAIQPRPNGGDRIERSMWPHFLPDGRHFLFVDARAGLKVGSLDSTDVTVLSGIPTMAAYAAGHLFFWRPTHLMAQRFDPGTLALEGEPFSVVEQIGVTPQRFIPFSISSTGVLAYAIAEQRPVSQLTWIDRSGKTTGLVGEGHEYMDLALAPDGRRVAAAFLTDSGGDVWL